jgi:hypothetical protein
MAGTLTITTLSDGTNSTSATNPIRGSARAWVNFNGTNGAIRASFNISSATRTSSGNYTVNFTTAMPNTNYLVTGSASSSASGVPGNSYTWFTTGAASPDTFSRTTTACNVQSPYVTNMTADVDYVNVIFFSS